MSEGLTSDTLPLSAAGAVADAPSIPGYETLAELGRGGMGVVYQARHTATGQLVALKLIRDGALAGPAERARFQIEVEAAARLRHPNVVQIDQAGSHDGRAFLAMELVAGGSLEQRLAGRPQPPREAAALALSLARAMQYAHEQQIVHRDLKPANILLEGDSAAASLAALRPKIADFGLAKRLDAESAGWTTDGAILGTVNYMAPEQAAGRTQEIGPAADVYALGAILYEMLAGRPPFRLGTWQETLLAVLNDEASPPSRWREDSPPELDTICLKCLQKERTSRYGSAEELAVDLESYLAGRPLRATPESRRDRWARLAARDAYELQEELGPGPRSLVFRARHGALGAPVAVKVFIDVFASREAWEERLRANSHRLAALRHPQLALAQQSGWWDDAAYLVTEQATLGSLDAKLKGGPLPVREALRIVEQVAEIVSYAHRQGVTHGNLKPANVLLFADDIPRLCDFRFTGGMFQGAPTDDERDCSGLARLAPELVRDRQAEANPHTDVYGLGVILYELLAGRAPFVGDDSAELAERVLSQDPDPPSAFNPSVPPLVDAACLRCLQKNPWERYHRAFALRNRLRWLQQEPSPR